MDSFLDFKNAEAALAQLAEQLAEEKIPVQHATDGVAKVLGTKSAVKFLTHLRPGAEKHTSWDKVNSALSKQGVKTHHIAKIASHIKPAQYKEEVDVTEEKDIVIRDKSGKVTKWSHEGDWHKSGSGTTTDKSGAKHTPYSKARDLARSALKKTLTKEEIEQIDELQKSTLASYAKKSAAELPKHQMNATYKAVGPIAAAHAGKHPKTGESPIEWDNRKVKNRGAGVARAVDKLAKEEVEITEEIHRVGVTVSDPHHQAVTMRKEKVQKFVRIKGGSKEEAVERGKKHFKGKGWKVHDAEHAGMVHEEVQIDELSNATLQSYKDKAMKSADALAAKGQHSKANDRYLKHMQASGKQISHTMQNIHKAMQQRQQSEEVESDDDHFSKQSPKMQSAINLHLRKGKNYKDAVAAAAKHVKEEVEIEEAMDKDSLRKALSKHEQHAIDANRRGDDEAVKMHQDKMNKIKDKMAKLARSV